jgi:hypothetical protein
MEGSAVALAEAEKSTAHAISLELKRLHLTRSNIPALLLEGVKVTPASEACGKSLGIPSMTHSVIDSGVGD